MTSVNYIPEVICYVQTSRSPELLTADNEIKVLKLRGIVYCCKYHFTSHIVSLEQ